MASDGEFSADISQIPIDPDRERELFEKQNECVFMWATSAGEPVGVVMCYLHHGGTFWLCLMEERARVAAVRRDPRSSICISSAGTDMGRGKAVTFKGTTRVYDHDDPKVAGWFFEAFARRLHRGKGDQL
jgi:general stress protein 26